MDPSTQAAQLVNDSLSLAQHGVAQDVETTPEGTVHLRRGVAKDRRISVEDGEMRHGRKSRSSRVDGYKRHLVHELDSGLVPAVGLTAANVPEASVSEAIEQDLAAQQLSLRELHIDRAYLSSKLVKERSDELTIYCKAWAVFPRNGHFAKPAFRLEWQHNTLTCPNQVAVALHLGKVVRFPKRACSRCALQSQCTSSQQGRSISIHPDEPLLDELRHRQLTPQGRMELRQRTAVEHSLAHVGHWQGDRARYRGKRKNLFDLRRMAVIHNLHVIARMPIHPQQQVT